MGYLGLARARQFALPSTVNVLPIVLLWASQRKSAGLAVSGEVQTYK